MRTKIIHTNAFLTITLATLIAGCGCGDPAPNTVENEPHSTGDNPAHGTDMSGATTDGASNTNSGDARNSDANRMDPSEIRINGSAVGTPAYNERYAASKNVRGYRSALMAELDAIRLRLNDGTRPDDVTKKDQARAADLAQGLERMDRLILAVEESDDLTWTSIRSSSLKEAEDVRVWATEHGYKGNG